MCTFVLEYYVVNKLEWSKYTLVSKDPSLLHPPLPGKRDPVVLHIGHSFVPAKVS